MIACDANLKSVTSMAITEIRTDTRHQNVIKD